LHYKSGAALPWKQQLLISFDIYMKVANFSIWVSSREQ